MKEIMGKIKEIREGKEKVAPQEDEAPTSQPWANPSHKPPSPAPVPISE
jgi:hypothetical protein